MSILDDALKAQIQAIYRNLLNGKQVRARLGQRMMIAEIARYLGDITTSDGLRTSPHGVCVIEAGTGTGKTLGYLIPLLPIARAMGKKLVVSTATVALQDQLVSKDLPDLEHYAKLNVQWALAKGRGRYLCMSRLEGRLHEHGATDSESLPLFLLDPAMSAAADDHRSFYETLLASYASRTWDGDRDHWREVIPDEIWRGVTTDHRQCTNRHCAYFDNCAFFDARRHLDQADIIIANHDLVLADLALGGGAILPKPEDTVYVFDEAHHLPDKALSHFAAHAPLEGGRSWLKQLAQILARMLPALPAAGVMARTLENAAEFGRATDQGLTVVLEWILENTPWEDTEGRTRTWRYPGGEIPEALRGLAKVVLEGVAGLCRTLGVLNEELQKGFDERKTSEADRETADAWFPVVGTLLNRAEEWLRLWQSFAQADTPGQGPPPARWLEQQRWEHTSDVVLFSSPILADDLLYTRLWSRCHAAILTSATLTALGRFDRLRMQAGLPEHSRYQVVPSAFRYAEMATVEVPLMPAEPGDSDAYTQALIRRLPELWGEERGILVLFNSRRQMQDVRAALDANWPDLILGQDDHARGEVLRRHRERIDGGQRSILFGVASFAEGIDLPGEYLQHVIITRLPFAVPDDPIEASLAEWVTQRGGNPFMEITVPDASVRLVQAAGRLLRTEQDTGRISILDRRIVTRRYGQLLLDALPPFRRIIHHAP